jgi:hypothetical protein
MCEKLPILIPMRRREKGTRENGIRRKGQYFTVLSFLLYRNLAHFHT